MNLFPIIHDAGQAAISSQYEVNIFRNLKSKTPYVTTLEKIAEIIRTSPQLKQYTMDARAYRYAGERSKYDGVKLDLLPAFAPSGFFAGGNAKNNLTGLTGICLLDINGLSKRRAAVARYALKDCPFVMMVYRRLSGTGIHVLVPYTVRNDEPEEVQVNTWMDVRREYGIIAGILAHHLGNILRLPFDNRKLNAERLCALAYDEHIHINQQATPVIINYEWEDPIDYQNEYRQSEMTNIWP